MARGGGTVTGELWLVRAKALRDGDRIRCGSWGGTIWGGGEVLVVSATAPTGLRDGYLYIWTYAESCPSAGRVLCMLLDDQITMVARLTEPVVKKEPKVKPKKGEQLKLF